MRVGGGYGTGESSKGNRCAASDSFKLTDLDCIQSHGKADSLIVVGHLLLYNDCALVVPLLLRD